MSPRPAPTVGWDSICNFTVKITSYSKSPRRLTRQSITGIFVSRAAFGYDFVYHPKRVTTPLARRYCSKANPNRKDVNKSLLSAKTASPSPILKFPMIGIGSKQIGTLPSTSLPIISFASINVMAQMRWQFIAAPKPRTRTIIFYRKCIGLCSAQIMWIIATVSVTRARSLLCSRRSVPRR